MMVNLTLLAGGYTTFITRFTFQFDPFSAHSSLIDTGTFNAGTNPSWITLSPSDRNVLYATNEISVGGLLSFTLDKSGMPTEVDSIPSGGDSPAFVGTFNRGKEALVLNFSSGNGTFAPINQDSLHFGSSDTRQNITFPPPEGGVSHPHYFVTYGSELLVVDLGSDKVWRLSKNKSGLWAITGFIPQLLKSGPRRAVIFGKTIYVLHEDDNTLTSQLIPDSPFSTEAPIIQSIRTIGPGFNATNGTFAAAELLTPPPSSRFPTQFLYTSNRAIVAPEDDDPAGDTIAIFTLHPFKKVREVATGLHNIRGIEFGGPENEFLAAAGVAGNGNGVAIFQRVAGGSDLKLLARNNGTNAQSRSSFVWL